MTDLYSHELYKNQGIVVRFPAMDQVIRRVAFIGNRERLVYVKKPVLKIDFFCDFLTHPNRLAHQGMLAANPEILENSSMPAGLEF